MLVHHFLLYCRVSAIGGTVSVDSEPEYEEVLTNQTRFNPLLSSSMPREDNTQDFLPTNSINDDYGNSEEPPKHSSFLQEQHEYEHVDLDNPPKRKLTSTLAGSHHVQNVLVRRHDQTLSCEPPVDSLHAYTSLLLEDVKQGSSDYSLFVKNTQV